MGRYDEAIGAYHRALEIDADDIPALSHLGVDLHRVGNFQEALKTFERIQQIDPSYEPSYCRRILTYGELGDHERAEEMFYLARLYKEHCPHCYYNIGCSLADRGLYDKAIYCWQKTMDLDDPHPEVQMRIAEALWGTRELESSRQHYLVGLRQDPGNTGILLDLGELLDELGRDQEADEKFRRAIELAPEEPAGYFCHGRWLMRRGRDNDALAAFCKVLQLDPTCVGAHLKIGELYYRRRDLPAARKHLRAELLLRPQDPQVLIGLSNLLLDTGQNRAAVACLKRLVQIDPRSMFGWQNLAVAHSLTGRYEEGIAAGKEAARLSPGNPTAIYNIALACQQLQRFDEAIEWVRLGQRFNPRDLSLQSLEWWVRLRRWRAIAGRCIRSILPFRG
jgi:tetratricopeptide (TPR) repeat protein